MGRSVASEYRDSTQSLTPFIHRLVIISFSILVSVSLYLRVFAGTWPAGSTAEFVLPITIGLILIGSITWKVGILPIQFLIAEYIILYGIFLKSGPADLPFPEWYGSGLFLYGITAYMILSWCLLKGIFYWALLTVFGGKNRIGERFGEYLYHRGIFNSLQPAHRQTNVISIGIFALIVIMYTADFLRVSPPSIEPLKELKYFFSTLLLLMGVQILISNRKAHKLDASIAYDPDFKESVKRMTRFKIKCRRVPRKAVSTALGGLITVKSLPRRLWRFFRKRILWISDRLVGIKTRFIERVSRFDPRQVEARFITPSIPSGREFASSLQTRVLSPFQRLFQLAVSLKDRIMAIPQALSHCIRSIKNQFL